MHVVQRAACRSCNLHIKSVTLNQQAKPLTLASLHGRAPMISEEIRGGQSTSDNLTKSATSSSFCPPKAAKYVISICLALFVNLLTSQFVNAGPSTKEFYEA